MPSHRLLLCSLLVALLAPASRSAADASSAFAPCTDGDALCGHNRDEQLALRFAGGGVTVRAHEGSAARLELVSFGRAGTTAPVHAVRRTVTRSRVVYERGALTEWFKSGPQGLQQGFDVAHRPAGQGELELALSVEGLVPELRDADQVALMRDGVPRLVYRALRAWDARGTELPSRMAVREGRIVLRVEDRGARYPIVIDPFVQQAKIQPADLQKNYNFGDALAVAGDRLFVGARGDDQAGNGAGAVHVLDWDGTAWVPRTKLTAKVPSLGALFGSSVAISGTTLAIGAELESYGDLYRPGAAYVFEQDGDGYRQQERVTAHDAAASDYFGIAIDVDGDTLAVGTSLAKIGDAKYAGAVYIFTRIGETWTEVQKLTSPTTQALAGFGGTLALSGDTLLVGADTEYVAGVWSGAAYVFRRGAEGFVLEQKLVPVRTSKGQGFGGAVALEGDRALVGASNEGAPGEDYGAGAAYVFERSGSAWKQTARLSVNEPKGADFGTAVTLDGDTALIGASGGVTAGVETGAAYVFVLSRGTWHEQARVLASDGVANDQFGSSVGLSGRHVLVGAPWRADFGKQSGAVYAFEDGLLVIGSPCSNGAECPTGFCADGVCCNDTCGGSNPLDCRSCRAAHTGLADGTCALVPADTACGDPREAPCDAADRCSATGTCQALRSADGTACEAGAFCTEGDICKGGVCDEGAAPHCGSTQKCNETVDLCYAACGDGVKDLREDCDEGRLNSDETQDACRTTCRLAGCGDGVIDTGEACDRATGNSDEAPNGCRTSCVVAHCGDGVLDSGEGCDEGEANGMGPCRGDCSLQTCGDGRRDPGEACDEGAENSRTRPDACRPSCVVAHCGDGVRDSEEACDSGPLLSDAKRDACRTTCALPTCGDGVVDSGEACDTAGPSATCTDACDVPPPRNDAGLGDDAGPAQLADAGVAPAPDGGNHGGEPDAGRDEGPDHARSGCALSRGAAPPRFALAIVLLALAWRSARRRSKAGAQE